jgi:hypothetical protein
MEAVAIIIILASIGAGLFGLINLVKPLGLLRIRRRRYAAAVVGGSVFAFFCGALLGAASQPGGLNTGIERAEKENGARGAGAAPKVEQPAGVTQAEFDAYYNGVQDALRPCDTAVTAAAESIQGGDVYSAYPVVSRAEDLCLSTGSDVRSVKIPRSARGEVKKAFEEARDACEYVGTAKWSAMRQAAKVLDGDSRPSTVSNAKAELGGMNTATIQCVTTILGVAVKAGVKLPGEK